MNVRSNSLELIVRLAELYVAAVAVGHGAVGFVTNEVPAVVLGTGNPFDAQ